MVIEAAAAEGWDDGRDDLHMMSDTHRPLRN